MVIPGRRAAARSKSIASTRGIGAERATSNCPGLWIPGCACGAPGNEQADMASANRIARIASLINGLNGAIGRGAAWLALAIGRVQFAVVILRYVLGIGSIWLQESILYAHAALFLLAAAWTLQAGG